MTRLSLIFLINTFLVNVVLANCEEIEVPENLSHIPENIYQCSKVISSDIRREFINPGKSENNLIERISNNKTFLNEQVKNITQLGYSNVGELLKCYVDTCYKTNNSWPVPLLISQDLTRKKNGKHPRSISSGLLIGDLFISTFHGILDEEFEIFIFGLDKQTASGLSREFKDRCVVLDLDSDRIACQFQTSNQNVIFENSPKVDCANQENLNNLHDALDWIVIKLSNRQWKDVLNEAKKFISNFDDFRNKYEEMNLLDLAKYQKSSVIGFNSIQFGLIHESTEQVYNDLNKSIKQTKHESCMLNFEIFSSTNLLHHICPTHTMTSGSPIFYEGRPIAMHIGGARERTCELKSKGTIESLRNARNIANPYEFIFKQIEQKL